MPGNFLTKILKAPEFLNMKPVGINITDSAVFYVFYGEGRHGKSLRKHGEKKLPEGAVVNGEIKKADQVVAVLSEIREDNNFQFVRASLPEEESYLFKMIMPNGVKNCEQVRQNVEFRLEENVPLPPNQVIFDFEVLSLVDGCICEIMVSAVPIRIVDSYLDVFAKAELMVTSFLIESQAVARAVVPVSDHRPYIVINIKEKSSTISVIENGIVQFSSTAAIGGHSIDEAISRQLSITMEEAVKVKNEHLYGEGKGSIEVFSYLLNYISAVKDEVERFYAYWQDKHTDANGKRPEIGKVILCGRNSLITGFERYLYLALKKDVERANVWVNAFSLDQYLPKIDFVDSLDYAASAGLGLEDNK